MKVCAFPANCTEVQALPEGLSSADIKKILRPTLAWNDISISAKIRDGYKTVETLKSVCRNLHSWKLPDETLFSLFFSKGLTLTVMIKTEILLWSNGQFHPKKLRDSSSQCRCHTISFAITLAFVTFFFFNILRVYKQWCWFLWLSNKSTDTRQNTADAMIFCSTHGTG